MTCFFFFFLLIIRVFPMSKFALPFFNGSPSDDLEAVDVYAAKVPTEVRNKFKPNISAFGTSLENTLGRQNDVLSNVGDALKGGSFDAVNAKDVLMDTLKGSRNVSAKLQGNLKKDLLSELGKSITGKPIRINAFDKSVDLGYGSKGTAEVVAGLLGDLTGKGGLFEVLNLGAEAAIFNSAIKEVVKWGIPELLDNVLEEIKDEKERKKIAARTAQSVVNTGNIDSVEVFLNKVGPEALLSQFPNLPRTLLQQYRFKSDVTPEKYPVLLTQLFRVMDKLLPTWILTKRGSATVWNLSLINTASDDALTLLKSDAQYRIPAMIAPEYPSRGFGYLMKSMYPQLPIVA